MAIFTSQYDKENVPLLVQLAQIDTENQNELHHAYDLLTAPEDNQGGMSTPNTPEGLAVVAEVCDVVRRTFLGLATKNAIPADCVAWINRKQRAQVYWEFTADEGEPRTDQPNEEGFVPLDSLSVAFLGEQNYDVVERILFPLKGWVATSIRDYQMGHGQPFALCIECENPFIADNNDNRKRSYCSRRCSARAGERRRYAERKA